MRRLALVATAVAACAAAAWGGGPTAQGAGSDDRREAGLPAEHIVWTQVVDVDFNAARIMVAGPDGESRQRLTHPAEGVFDFDPRVSPDGRMVAFERDDPEGNGHLMLMGIDGRGLREVDVCDDPCFSANGPTWYSSCPPPSACSVPTPPASPPTC